ncbi:MAG: hypothetical protein JWL63_2398 [Rhodocyclales bacterium]|nr:hypothetical protein [Rhodocyclales bacterium]
MTNNSNFLTRAARALCLMLVFLLGFEPVVWAAPTITYLHNDAAGSPVAATDESGAVLWRESYRPYGDRVKNEAAASSNRQFFHGKPLDTDSGLSYFGARYYDPVVGRFMGVDPVGFSEDNFHSFNRYAYGNNNPYRYRDSDGRFSIPLAVGVTVVAIAIAVAEPPELRARQARDLSRLWNAAKGIFSQDNNNLANDPEVPAADGQKDVKKRPSRVRKGTEQGNWDNAEDGEQGGKLCPTCGKEVKSRPGEKGKDWDNDHHPDPWRDRDLTDKDRKGVLDEYNRDTRLRCVGCNRSDNGK